MTETGNVITAKLLDNQEFAAVVRYAKRFLKTALPAFDVQIEERDYSQDGRARVLDVNVTLPDRRDGKFTFGLVCDCSTGPDWEYLEKMLRDNCNRLVASAKAKFPGLPDAVWSKGDFDPNAKYFEVDLEKELYGKA